MCTTEQLGLTHYLRLHVSVQALPSPSPPLPSPPLFAPTRPCLPFPFHSTFFIRGLTCCPTSWVLMVFATTTTPKNLASLCDPWVVTMLFSYSGSTLLAMLPQANFSLKLQACAAKLAADNAASESLGSGAGKPSAYPCTHPSTHPSARASTQPSTHPSCCLWQ